MDHIEEAKFCHRGVLPNTYMDYSRRVGRLLMTTQRSRPSQDTLGRHGKDRKGATAPEAVGPHE